jgi:hypothetical protein
VQRHRELDQRFEINLAPFGSHAVENFASVLLPGRWGRQKKGAPLLVAHCQKRSPLFLLKQQSAFLADKRLKELGKLRQKPGQEHFQAHVILGYVD